MDKIQRSINLIQKAEKLALSYQKYGFHLAFSGGKDSQVIYELAKMAGVHFKAVMNITTLDPPELMSFIRKQYPDIEFTRPPINFYKLLIKKRLLPTRIVRYCCQYLKESSGIGAVVITGIRKAESSRRSKRNEMEVSNYKYSNTLDQFNMDFESKAICIKGKDKIILNPIIHWSDRDVWQFIKSKNIPYCKLYDEGYKRIGCILCPMASEKTKVLDMQRYPKVCQKIKQSIGEILKSEAPNYWGALDHNIDDIFEWWITGVSMDIYKKNKANDPLFYEKYRNKQYAQLHNAQPRLNF